MASVLGNIQNFISTHVRNPAAYIVSGALVGVVSMTYIVHVLSSLRGRPDEMERLNRVVSVTLPGVVLSAALALGGVALNIFQKGSSRPRARPVEPEPIAQPNPGLQSIVDFLNAHRPPGQAPIAGDHSELVRAFRSMIIESDVADESEDESEEDESFSSLQEGVQSYLDEALDAPSEIDVGQLVPKQIPENTSCALMGDLIPQGLGIVLNEQPYDARYFLRYMLTQNEAVSPYTKEPLSGEDLAAFCAIFGLCPSQFERIWSDYNEESRAHSEIIAQFVDELFDTQEAEALGDLPELIHEAQIRAQSTGDATEFNQLQQLAMEATSGLEPPQVMEVNLGTELRTMKLLRLIQQAVSQGRISKSAHKLIVDVIPDKISVTTSRFLEMIDIR